MTRMTEIEMPHPVWVDNKAQLSSLLAGLRHQALIAVDTESNSLHAYHEQVCLIQFSTPAQDYLLDPLAGLDLSPLGEIFANPEIEMVFHAAEYDVICLRRDFGFTFHNIFDTMQAARILGREKVGLGDLLEVEFGIRLDKHNQKADWAERPLDQSMQSYACLDTHYLIRLREKMKSALEQVQLLPLAQEDFRRVCHATATENHKPLYMQVSGYQDLNPRQLAVLEALSAYRDQRARNANRPHFKILGNAALLAIARACPRSLLNLQKTAALNPRQMERHAVGLLQAVEKGLRAPPINLPHRKRPDQCFLTRLDRLKAWRKQAAEKMSVLSDVVLPRDILEAVASANPQSLPDLQACMASVPYRFSHFGVEILNVIKEK